MRPGPGLTLGAALWLVSPAPAAGQVPVPGADEILENLDGIEPSTAETLKTEVDNEFARPRYRFCHDRKYAVRRPDRRLCRLSSENRDRCPAFGTACDSAPGPEPRSWLDIRLPELGGVLRLVFWGALALALAALVVTVLRSVASSQRRSAAPPAPKKPTRTEAPPSVPRIVERDVQRLVDLARDCAARGEFDTAIAHLYAALLRQLELASKLRVTPQRTNGEYVRDLAQEPELQSLVRSTARELESAQFGGRPCTAENFESTVKRLQPMLGRAFTTLGLLVALGSNLACSGPPARNALASGIDDDGPAGYSAFAQLLESRDASVRRRIQELDSLGTSDPDTVIVHPTADPEPSEWESILEWTRAGGRLVLSGVADDYVREALEIGTPDYEVCSTSVAIDPKLGASSGARVVAHTPFVVLEGSWQSVVTCGSRSYVAQRPVGAGQVLLFSDPDFLANASLAAADNGIIALELIGSPTLVEVVDGLTGAGVESPYLALKNSGLGLLFLQGLVFLLVLYLGRGVQFGTPIDPALDRRRAFSEHVRAIGGLYSKRRASRYALGMYATWAIERLHERLQPEANRSLLSLSAAVAERVGQPESDVVRVLVDANEAREDPNALASPAQDLTILRALDKLVRATGGIR